MSGNEIVPRGASEEDAAAAAEFDQWLFKDGILEFDLDLFLERHEQEVAKHRDSLKERSSLTPEELFQLVEAWKSEIGDELLWQRKFSGKVPKAWENWVEICFAFQWAGSNGFQLNPTLIEAGVCHPSIDVVSEVGKNQRLDAQQLSFILARSDLLHDKKEEILWKQRWMGVSEEVIREANRSAKEIRDRIREKKREKPKLEGS